MKARAFIIGLNDYPASAGQRALAGAVADAIDFALWALNPSGGGVNPADLYFWVHDEPAALPPPLDAAVAGERPWPHALRPDFSQAPDAQEIKRGVFEAARQAAASGVDERLYILFAAHGVQTNKVGYTQDPQNCLVAGDYVAGESSGLIPLDDLRRALESQGPAESLFFFDCCRNALMPTVPKPELGLSEYAPADVNQQWLLGRAAKSGRIAYETPLECPARGAFSKMTVQALRQFRVDNMLTFPQLLGFVTKGVAELVKPKTQVPDMSLKDDSVPFPIVVGPPLGDIPELKIHVVNGAGGQISIFDHANQPVGESLPVDGPDIVIPLAPGFYTIEHRPSGRYKVVFHSGPEPTDEQL